MAWNKRFAFGAAGAMMLAVMGMLAAEATCTSNNSSPPDGYMTTTVCALEGNDHGDPYTGRDTRPLGLSLSEGNSNGSYSSTEIHARQNRIAYEAGGQAWRESSITIDRAQYVQPLVQYADVEVGLYQYHLSQTDQPDQQYTTGIVDVHTHGAIGTVQAYAAWQQYPNGDGCSEQGIVYLRANNSTSSTPVDQQECVIEAPMFPDMP